MSQDTRRNFPAVVLACLAILLIAVPAFSQSASGGRALSNAQILGAANQSKQISVTFWLNQHDKAGFDEAVRQMYDRNSPNFHHWLTLNEYKTRFAPTAGDMAVVRQHLAANNLRVVATDKLNRYVTASGIVADVQRAAGVQLNRISIKGEVHRAPGGAPVIAGAAGKLISAVQGLSDLKYQNHSQRPIDPDTGQTMAMVPLSKVRPASNVGPAEKFFFTNCLRATQSRTFKTGGGFPKATYTGARYGANIDSPQPNLPPCGYNVPQIDKAYGLTSLYKQGLDGTGQTVVIVDAFGSDSITSDANVFSQINGLPALTHSNFAIFFPTGPTSCGGDNTTCGSWFEETSLDVEWAHAVAPGANIALVLAVDNSFSALDLSVLFAIDNLLGPVISGSYGLEEDILAAEDPSELVVQNSLSQLAASLGISTNFSSGDNGDFFLQVGENTVSMPAASPFATSIGGTSLFLNSDHTIKLQTGWGNNETRIADVSPNPPVVPPLHLGFVFGSGGGTSAVFSKPSYQDGLPGSGRLVPDISYLADPETGAEIIFSQSGGTFISTVGGTSLACPMFSAMWAITTQSAGGLLGQAAPLLYGLPPDAITDILAVDGPRNVTGIIHQPPAPPIVETADDLAAPLGNTTNYVSTLYNSPFSTRWFVLTFGTDSSLTTGPGWDNVTGLGTPNGASFVTDVSAAVKK
jgi:subtilase family serine protease